MSTFANKAINPKPNRTQEAWFIDDFYGQHESTVAFRKDGGNAVFSADKIKFDNYGIYPLFEIKSLSTA